MYLVYFQIRFGTFAVRRVGNTDRHQKVFNRLNARGALHLCSGAWHFKIWTKIAVL